MNASGSPLILTFGDSLTAGYGLAAAESFPARLQQLLRDDWPEAIVMNGGVSGDTTASALLRLPRLLSTLRARPDLAIVELGANDLLRGIPVDRTRVNLDAILRQLLACGIQPLLAAMELPSFLGPFSVACNHVYDDLAARHGIGLHPFFPPGLLGHPEMVLRDRLHPNARAIELIAKGFVEPVAAALGRQRSTRPLSAPLI